MAEPVTSSLAAAAAAGAGAALLSALGLEAQPLFWSAIGSYIGLTFAAETPSKVRAVLTFACAVLVCSLGGATLAVYLFKGEQIYRNALSALMAVAFHLILVNLPAALGDLRRKYLGGTPNA